MEIITNGELFNEWYEYHSHQNLSTQDTFQRLVKYVLKRLKNQRPKCQSHLKTKIKGFCTTVKKKWLESSYSHVNFIRKNSAWLSLSFKIGNKINVANSENVSPGPSSPTTPTTSFTALSRSSKMRKIESFVRETSPEKIMTAASKILRDQGNPAGAQLLKNITNESPKKSKKMLNIYKRESKLISLEEKIIPLSNEEALALLIDSKMNVLSYCNFRKSIKSHGAKDLLPPYYKVKAAKVQCYPNNITISERGASVPLQDILQHTFLRLKETIIFPQDTFNKLTFICKYGCDGSSNHNEYIQKRGDADETSSDSEEEISDKSVFLFSLVPLQLETENKIIVWKNERPSSVKYCRPIKMLYVKETIECIRLEVRKMEEEVNNLKPLQINVDDRTIEINFQLLFTMIDGKVINALTGTPSSNCFICNCTPKDMSNIEKIRKMPNNTQHLKYGISSLHAWIKFLECILHIAYKLELKKPTTHGATKEQRECIASRKRKIQLLLRKQLGIRVDIVIPGGGTSNTGNVARIFFKNFKKVAAITEINEELIYRFWTILVTISSGQEINSTEFHKYTEETVMLYEKLYKWYRMPVSVHKILVHGSSFIQHFLLPIGELSEEAQEAGNKIYRRLREHHTRKNLRINTISDLFRMLLASSDPLISSLRPAIKVKKQTLSIDVLKLIKCDTDTSGNEEDHSDEEDYFDL